MEVSWMRKGGSEVASRVNMGDKDKTWEHCLWAEWRPGVSDMEEISRREQQRVREAVTRRRVLEAVKILLIDKLVHLGTNLGCPGLGPSNLGCSSLGLSRKAKFLKVPQQGERQTEMWGLPLFLLFLWPTWVLWTQVTPFPTVLGGGKTVEGDHGHWGGRKEDKTVGCGWGKKERQECKEGNHWVQPVSQDLLSDFIDGETEAQGTEVLSGSHSKSRPKTSSVPVFGPMSTLTAHLWWGGKEETRGVQAPGN